MEEQPIPTNLHNSKAPRIAQVSIGVRVVFEEGPCKPCCLHMVVEVVLLANSDQFANYLLCLDLLCQIKSVIFAKSICSGMDCFYSFSIQSFSH